MAQSTLSIASIMKICDRGMSYSINRASKELLYIPVDPAQTYQAKAWIDMFGYRAFKVLGSLLILGLTHLDVSALGLSWLTVVICAVWMALFAGRANEYRRVLPTAEWHGALA